MQQKTLIIGGIVALAIVAFLAAPFFLPKDTVELDQELPPGESTGGDGTEPAVDALRGGAWKDGDAAHKASGQIDLVTVDGAPYLRFTDFQMTSGPDVYLYLSKSNAPSSTSDVEGDGIRINVITDQDKDARLNERGTFFVALDRSVEELAGYQTAVAWCDDFNVIFGTAALA